MLLKFSYLIFLFLFARSILAAESIEEEEVQHVLLSISDDLYYNYRGAMDKVDSVLDDLAVSEVEELKPYFDYFNAYTAYQNSNYSEALTFADSALTYFLWHKNVEWESRCLLIMAFTAEMLTLDNYALSYYETSYQLASHDVVQGVSALGIARSKKRLNKNFITDLDKAITLLEKTNIVELQLLAKRSYYSFNIFDKSLVYELKKVEKTYKQLGYQLYAAATNKQISYYYKDKEDYLKAEEYALKAITLIENTRDSISVFTGSLYLYYSNILLLLEQYDSAQKYIELSISIYLKLDINHSNYYAYQRLSRINRMNNNYKEADFNSQNAILCQHEMNEVKRSSSALLAEIIINREYIDGELRKREIYYYIRLGLFVVISLVFFRTMLSRFRRQVEARDEEVNKLQENNTVLQKNTMELLSIVKKLEKESSLVSASEDFEKRIMNDVELSSTLPHNFCRVYQKNISSFSFQHPKLTQAEVRTAVMIAMDIPSKSIVKLQCVEPDTLKTYRKRIRKKLKLEQGIELNMHLKTLLYDLGTN